MDSIAGEGVAALTSLTVLNTLALPMRSLGEADIDIADPFHAKAVALQEILRTTVATLSQP